ncbi:MAG: hypothetical protein AAF849_15185, partial [Bacteroidota bacterium]
NPFQGLFLIISIEIKGYFACLNYGYLKGSFNLSIPKVKAVKSLNFGKCKMLVKPRYTASYTKTRGQILPFGSIYPFKIFLRLRKWYE